MLRPKEVPPPTDTRPRTVNTNFKIEKIVTPANVKIEPVVTSTPAATDTTAPAATTGNMARRTTKGAAIRGGSLGRLAGLTLGLAAVIVVLLMLQPSSKSEAELATAQQPQPVGTAPVPVADAAIATVPPENTSNTAADDIVARMTAGTLAALRSQPASPAASAPPETGTAADPTAGTAANTESSALYALVLKAVNQGQSEAYVDQLLNEALRAGEISVPQALIRKDGSVDTATILAVFTGN